MGRRPQHVDEVERMLDAGYSVKDIVRTTNISQPTVYRVLNKLKKEARYDFKNLMSEDYLWKYLKTLQNFDLTIKQCNNEIDYMKSKYDTLEKNTNELIKLLPDSKAGTKAMLMANLTSIQSNRTNEIVKLCAQRDKASETKAKVYNQGPVVNAIDEWVNGGNAKQADLPELKLSSSDDTAEGTTTALTDHDTTDDDTPSRLNKSVSINTSDDEEDRKIIEEMKKDEL